MKKLLALVLTLALLATLPVLATAETETPIKIGSTWWDLDVHGILGDSAAAAKLAGEALGFDVAFNTGALEISGEAAITAVEDLIAAGCNGITVINYSESCLVKIASLCEDAGVYFCQMYRTISDPEVAAALENNPYYVGRVHEDEYTTSYALAEAIAQAGCKNVALISENHGDNTNETRAQAYRDACEANGVTILTEEWQTATDSMTDYTTNLLMAYPELDGFLLIQGGFVPYVVAAEDNLGIARLPMVCTDFGSELTEYMEDGSLTAAAGGHHNDTMFAMLLVYNAIKGAYDPADYPIDVVNNMVILSKPTDYQDFITYFAGWDVDFHNNQAYTVDEIRNLSITYNPDHKWQDIVDAAAALTLEDVMTRHGFTK